MRRAWKCVYTSYSIVWCWWRVSFREISLTWWRESENRHEHVDVIANLTKIPDSWFLQQWLHELWYERITSWSYARCGFEEAALDADKILLFMNNLNMHLNDKLMRKIEEDWLIRLITVCVFLACDHWKSFHLFVWNLYSEKKLRGICGVGGFSHVFMFVYFMNNLIFSNL